MSDHVHTKVRNGTGFITLDRPKALNSLTLDMIRVITGTLLAWRDDDDIAAVVIRSTTEKALCAGGDIRFFGRPFAAVRGRVGYVPQRETVDWDFPVSVADVVLMGTYARLGWFRRPGSRERDLAGESLARVGLADVADRQIGRLSGGQQQRVFLARALAQQADAYLLDEPMAGVDARSQETIFGVLAELRDAGRLVVVVHHDLRTAASWFDRVALIDRRLVATGPTATALTAENLERTYAGHVDLLDELGRAVVARGRTP